MDEKALTTRIADGDKTALREAYDAFGREMYMFALTLTKGNEPNAEDILQECFVRVWENRRKLEAVQSLKGYLFRMLRNIFLNLKRTEDREMKRRSQLIVEAPSDSDIDIEALNREIDGLPEEQRQVLVLRIWGEMTLAQTAEVLGIPENTASSRYRYALNKLRDGLGDRS